MLYIVFLFFYDIIEFDKNRGDIHLRKSNLTKLTNRELDVLSILWNSEQPLTAAEISAASNGELTINAIQAVVRKLLKENLIEVGDIVYSGTVLCRNYKPTPTSKERILTQFSDEFRRFQSKFSVSSLLATLYAPEKDEKKRSQTIQELEDFLEKYKEQNQEEK